MGVDCLMARTAAVDGGRCAAAARDIDS